MDGDFCPLCEADRAKALAEKEAIEKARIEKEEAEKATASEAVKSKDEEVEPAAQSVEALNDHDSTKGMFPYSMNAFRC